MGELINQLKRIEAGLLALARATGHTGHVAKAMAEATAQNSKKESNKQ